MGSLRLYKDLPTVLSVITHFVSGSSVLRPEGSTKEVRRNSQKEIQTRKYRTRGRDYLTFWGLQSPRKERTGEEGEDERKRTFGHDPVEFFFLRTT